MNRQELALLVLGRGEGKPFSPVQIQKALFLATRNVPEIIDEGPSYKFEPYAYGPFDRAVYDDLRELARAGIVEIVPSRNGRWSEYRLTPEGMARSEDLALRSEEKKLDYVDKVAKFVLPLSFAKLVSAIYKAYPEMAENSVFASGS